jgi:hypothetical protein
MRCNLRTLALVMLLSVCGLSLLPTAPAFGAQTRKGRKQAGKPRSPAPPARFVSGRAAPRIPFDLLSNLVLLRARLNDSEPLWFILDTGADSTVVNARLAKELGLRPAGHLKGTSGGEAVEAGLVSGVSFKLPGVEVPNLTVATVPLDPLAPLMGRAIGGIFGNDLISRFVVEVDYGQRVVNLYAPAAYRYEGAGERLRVNLAGRRPFVDAFVTPKGGAPVLGRFAAATGSSGALLLDSRFVRAHRLLQTASATSLGNTGGVGGLSRTLVGRVENIRVGRFRIDDPIVSFSQAGGGGRAGAGFDGVLGGEVFRRFKVILDYSRRQLILEPNEHLSEAVEEDMSGFEFVAEGEDFGTYVINEIVPDSPASEAGLREEDELTEVEGRPARELGLERIRRLFMQEGKEYLLGIKRGEQRLPVKLKLRRLR